MEIRFKDIVILSFKKCYRVVCDHPFLVGIVCFLILLYKSCPFLFSLLFHASPVLVCTAILLGTLLSFGPNSIQEIEHVERVSDGITPLQAGVFGTASVIAPREESFSVGRFTNNKRELIELDSEVLISDGIESSKVEEANGLVECEPLIDVNTREIQFEKEEIEEAKKTEVSGLELEKRKEIFWENLSVDSVSRDEEISAENRHSGVQEAGTDIAENQRSRGQEGGTDVEGVDDEITRLSVRTREGDHIDFSMKDDKCINVDVSSDAESDEDEESSSPDATMAEIIPMLNELHLLLDSEDLHSAGLSEDGSDPASEQSHKSDNEYEVSDEDSENEGHVADKDDADDDEDEEETHEGKDDESKSAIKWTEDDEKNLMDLGSSELERNQRLENLIARRRARNNWRMLAEKNLIDFGTVDLPFNVPPITATRNNPFDLPDNSYDNMGFPPIPGSAPSILLPRRNPFDLPYESNEEKPDLKGDSFHQEFLTFPQKDALFRRHESFSVGHSSLGPAKLGQQENNWKLHFVPEKLDLEAVYPPYQTQQKVVDDLNLGSIPDIESISDVAENDIKFVEQKDDLEMEAIASPDHSSDRDDFRKGNHKDMNAVDLKKVDERGLDDVIKIMQRDVEKNDEKESSLSKLEAAEIVSGCSADESQFERKSLDKNYTSNSSSLSSSETVERTFDEDGEEELATLELRDSQLEVSTSLAEASREESDIQLSRETIDLNPHKEPVYDSSPSAVTPEKFHSFSSTSSDSRVESSNMRGSPVSDEMKDPYIATESGIHDGSIKNDSYSSGDPCSPSLEMHFVGETGQESLEVSQFSDDKSGSLELEFDIQRVSANSSDSSLESGPVDGAITPKEQITCMEEGSPTVEISQDFPLEVNQTKGFSMEEEEVVQHDVADFDSKVISLDSSHEHLLDSDEDKYSKPASNDGPLEQGATPDCLSFSNGSTSSSSESPEYDELATNWPTLKEETLDEIDSEEQRHVSEQLDFLAEEYKSQFTEKRINLEAGEKEEIDEIFLSNVSVPDIAGIKDVDNSSHVEFTTQEIEGESIDFESVPNEPIQTDTNLEVPPVIEARSMEHTDLDLKQIEGGSIDSDSAPKESVQTETNLEVPPVPEAKSMEHTNLDSKQLEGGSIKSDIVPEESVRTETNFEVPPILEARSMEHADLDSRQSEGRSIDSDLVPKESVQTETNIELPPVLKAISMEHTDSDSRQLEGGSIDPDSVPKESIQSETNLELPPVLESRSMEYTNLDFRQLHNGIDDYEAVSQSKVEPLAEEETKKPMNLNSDLEIVEVLTPEVSHVDPKENSEKTADQIQNFQI